MKKQKQFTEEQKQVIKTQSVLEEKTEIVIIILVQKIAPYLLKGRLLHSQML